MKTLSAYALLLLFSFVLVATGTAQTAKTADGSLGKKIESRSDLSAFLANTTWTWEHPNASNQSITFEAKGNAKQTFWVGKWSTTSRRGATIREPNGSVNKLTFSEDMKTFQAIHEKSIPITGKFVK